MKDSEYILAEAVKEVLVDMAVEGDLDGDIGQLDIQDVFQKAINNCRNDKTYKRTIALEKLGEFVYSDSYEGLCSQLEILENHPDNSEITGWIDGIQMSEQYETSYTVKTLLQEIFA